MHPIDGRISTAGRLAVAKVPYFSFAQNISKLISFVRFTNLRGACFAMRNRQRNSRLASLLFLWYPGQESNLQPFP